MAPSKNSSSRSKSKSNPTSRSRTSSRSQPASSKANDKTVSKARATKKQNKKAETPVSKIKATRSKKEAKNKEEVEEMKSKEEVEVNEESSIASVASSESDKKPAAKADDDVSVDSSRLQRRYLDCDSDTSDEKPPASKPHVVRSFVRKAMTPDRSGSLKRDTGSNLYGPPRLDVRAHASGHIVVIPKRTITDDKNHVLEHGEYYWRPLKEAIAYDTLDFNYNTGVCGKVTLRDLTGNPKKRDSEHPDENWEAMLFVSANGSSFTRQECEEIQQKVMREWNRHTHNTDVFRYKSKVKAGRIEADRSDPPKLDQTIISDDVISIMKLEFDIKNDKDLSDLANIDDIVGLYFKNIKEGSKLMKKYARNGPMFPHVNQD